MEFRTEGGNAPRLRLCHACVCKATLKLGGAVSALMRFMNSIATLTARFEVLWKVSCTLNAFVLVLFTSKADKSCNLTYYTRATEYLPGSATFKHRARLSLCYFLYCLTHHSSSTVQHCSYGAQIWESCHVWPPPSSCAKTP